jgi:predicted Zn-dependent peptidase
MPVALYPMMEAKTVSIGFFIPVGTIHEDGYPSGISHVIEHMIFKGTENYSAYDIALAMDHIGGELNAYTSKECTGILARILPEDLAVPITLVAEMLFKSLFDPEDLSKEKSVIQEEILSYEDSPEDISYDGLSGVIYRGSPLVHPILGTLESLERIDVSVLKAYFDKHYDPGAMVISVAGKFDSARVMALLNDHFGRNPVHKPHHPIQVHRIPFQGGRFFKAKDFEQTHIDIALWGPEEEHPLYYAMSILNNILGGTVSSRLFQRIREKEGLVYSIHSQINAYENAGSLLISYSLKESQVSRATDLILKELVLLRDRGITLEEFHHSKKHLIGSILLETETPEDYMSLTAKDLLYRRRLLSVDDLIRKIEATRFEAIGEVVRLIFDHPVALSAVGQMAADEFEGIYTRIRNELEGKHV